MKCNDIHLLELAKELGYDSKWVHCEAWSSNVPASEALCFGTVEDTIRHTKQCILDAAEGGGYILT